MYLLLPRDVGSEDLSMIKKKTKQHTPEKSDSLFCWMTTVLSNQSKILLSLKDNKGNDNH